MPFARYFCIFINVGLGEAAKRDVGTGENQIPDMASFASGDGWMKLPNGKILQYGRGAVTPTLSTQTMRITFSIPFPKKADCAMLTHSGDGGAPLGAGRGFVMTAEGPTLTGFNSAYRTSSTSDTASGITPDGAPLFTTSMPKGAASACAICTSDRPLNCVGSAAQSIRSAVRLRPAIPVLTERAS